MKRQLFYGVLTALLLAAPALHAQMPPGSRPIPKKTSKSLYSQSFMDASLEQIIDFYNEWTGRTLLIQADLKATITLKFSKLTKDEAMYAIESVLAQKGVALVPMGEKFLKVVPIATARQEGGPIEVFDPDKKFVEADKSMTQIIPLRYVVFADVQPIVQHLIHGYGKVISMDRINSIMVTDTSANIARIVEAIALVDQPLEKIEPRIYQLQHAKAGDIAGKLKELVEAAAPEAKQQKKTVAAPRTIPGVVRAPRTQTVTTTAGSAADETQMIQGDVKFVSDERTNILIIFSKQANFKFFDDIIKVLDVPVDPDVVVETIYLEYAEAKDISGILNDFIGAAKATEETKGPGGDGNTGENKSVQDVIAQRAAAKRTVSEAAKSAIGRLSEDTKIISDERTNSLILMGSKSDVEALQAVIASLDVMLQQVMIEAVILAIGLDDKTETGIEWVYDNAFDLNSRKRASTGIASVTSNGIATAVGKTAFNYLQTIPSIDLSVIVTAAKTDGDSRVLSTPIVMTTDNTEAKITIADERPVITSSINSGSGSVNNNYSARATYQYKTIGIDLTVTPHINPEGFVLMEIKQSADDVGGNVTVDGNEVPIISKREISATVGVQDRETIVLGGLIRDTTTESTTKIPLLGDIPLLGRLFSSRSNEEVRQELVVLLTPYVLDTAEEAEAEAERRYKSSDASNTEWPRDWSESKLSNDEPDKDAWKNKKKKKSDEE